MPFAVFMVVMGVKTDFIVERIMPSVERIIQLFNSGLR